jgi:hypothetical protein
MLGLSASHGATFGDPIQAVMVSASMQQSLAGDTGM